MDYTLADAAKIADVNRSTILRAIKSGKLSARRLEDRSYRVDAAELSRVFSLHRPLHTILDAVPRHAQAMQGDAQGIAEAVELAALRVKVELLERERETHQETIADLRRRLDQEQEERRTLQRQLTPPTQQTPQTAHKQPSDAPAQIEPAKAQKGFLARFLKL